MKTKRRAVLKKLLATVAGVSGTASLASAADDAALLQASNTFENLVFISGVGAHVEPFTIENHTEIVLKGVEASLKRAGSSMTQVLKAQVWLDDMKDFEAMNKIYRGRFGDKPPVRTTVAVAKGGVPDRSLVEIDVIAYKTV
ncbi:RidA family protein [Daejeonella lutea]|uniref:Enamine deaminase RidA, house cleaning of reactive enamine intermediates, YjgF/YER057c/UK114 family n=1 Tax=Daejeonella lutea TaxID=572036 RepID=A0A1T5A8T5_9SPHI|nr:RidA family protein [Daejeonella lutea]SKB31325.1 Enamine deaminase RidA, house cleaning of reactive enamine intermediates, YjgF/YER057c/UK114 family [Daejeonella lutea]